MNQQLVYFFATVAATIAITFWAARRNSGRASYYAAEGRISAPQTGSQSRVIFFRQALCWGSSACSSQLAWMRLPI